jgi:hypothetical protein
MDDYSSALFANLAHHARHDDLLQAVHLPGLEVQVSFLSVKIKLSSFTESQLLRFFIEERPKLLKMQAYLLNDSNRTSRLTDRHKVAACFGDRLNEDPFAQGFKSPTPPNHWLTDALQKLHPDPTYLGREMAMAMEEARAGRAKLLVGRGPLLDDFPGAKLVRSTYWGWQTTSHRDMLITIGHFAIAEHLAIRRYRPKLLHHAFAASLRDTLKEILDKCMAWNTEFNETTRKREKTTRLTWEWPDELDQPDAPTEDEHLDVEDIIKETQLAQSINNDHRNIASIVQAIEKNPLAQLHLDTDEEGSEEEAPVALEVREALDRLISVSFSWFSRFYILTHSKYHLRR